MTLIASNFLEQFGSAKHCISAFAVLCTASHNRRCVQTETRRSDHLPSDQAGQTGTYAPGRKAGAHAQLACPRHRGEVAGEAAPRKIKGLKQILAVFVVLLVCILAVRADDLDDLEKQIQQHKDAAEKEFRASRLALACEDPFREIDGSNYCLLPRFQYASNILAGLAPTDAAHVPCGEFEFIWGRVFQITDDGILMKKMPWEESSADDIDYELVFVSRIPSSSLVDNDIVALYAVSSGRHSYVTTQGARSTVPKYDFGRVLTPQEAAPLQKEFDDKIQDAARQRAAADSARKVNAANKKAEANARALEWNQQQADAGDPYGLLRMGQRYLHGDGVETNLAKARDYLQRSADLGNDTAKEELAKLQN